MLLNQGMATLKVPFDETKMTQGRPIQMKSNQIAVGLDVDCLEGRIYWSDVSGGAIRSSLYNGTDKTDFIVKEIGSPEGLAIDFVSRNIYWTDSIKNTIEVANIETKLRKILFNTSLVNPRGIAVHPQRGSVAIYLLYIFTLKKYFTGKFFGQIGTETDLKLSGQIVMAQIGKYF